IAYQRINPITAPVATSDTRLVAKYGYTMNSSPAANSGHRSCFLPYTNSTNPMPFGMSDTNSHVGSRDILWNWAASPQIVYRDRDVARSVFFRRPGPSYRYFRSIESGLAAATTAASASIDG